MQRPTDTIISIEQWWPSVVDATHLIVSGGKGSGKTTLVRAAMLELSRQGAAFVLIDPHYKLGEYGPGITPIAAGRRFEEARAAFAWGNQELDRRYKDRADRGVDAFPLVVFVVDEFDLFTDKRPDVSNDLRELASRFLSMIGDESRKVGIRLIVIAHGTEVNNLALQGRGSKRANYTIVQLRQGPNEQPEPTGILRKGSTVWTIDTTAVLDRAAGQLEPRMLVDLPEVAAAEDTSTDVVVLQRRIAELEHQLRVAGDKRNVKPQIERVEVPVLQPAELEVLQRLAELLPSAAGLITATLERIGTPTTLQKPQEPPVAPKKQKAAPRPSARRGKPRSTQTPRPARAGDVIDQMLAIPAIAAKVALAQRQVNDRAAGYMPRVLRTLWERTLTPREITEAQGTLSTTTLSRITTACQGLLKVGLLREAEQGTYAVNHAEIERLRGLASL